MYLECIKVALFQQIPQHSSPARQDEREREIERSMHKRVKSLVLWTQVNLCLDTGITTSCYMNSGGRENSSLSFLSKTETITDFIEDYMPGLYYVPNGCELSLQLFHKQGLCATAGLDFWCLKFNKMCI